MGRIDFKSAAVFLLIVGGACLIAYVIDQYYFAGRGYTFFFDIFKI